MWEIDKKSYFTRKYFLLLSKLAKNAIEYINACDYDIEGSVIGYMIIKHFGDLKRAKRMKFSALTKSEILHAFNSLQPLDLNMVNAGIARHVVDWIWGINISRALMLAVKEVSNKKIILSAGRVQSPTLIHVVDNDLERKLFVPLPYFKIKLEIKLGNKKLILYYDREFHSIEEAKRVVAELKEDSLIIKDIFSSRDFIPRPPPFNLTDLQVEAGRLYGLSPYRVERIAENLYLDGLISYPRTNSQKIPSTVNVNEIIENLSKGSFRYLINKLNMITKGKYIVKQGAKDDPAHPAIYPTGILPRRKLKDQEAKIYELIVRRFLASVATDAVVEKQKIHLEFMNAGISLHVNLQKLVDKGWLEFYPYKVVESSDLLDVKKGEKIAVNKIGIVMLITKPPSRLSKVAVLKWMEESKIGTEATRGKIIETLFQRKYLVNKGGYVYPTRLGVIVSEVLKEYFSELTDVKMTAEMEEKLNNIIYGKITKEDVIEESKQRISSYLSVFSTRKKMIGEIISKGLNLITYNKCKLCDFEATEKGLCKYHLMAFNKLDEELKIWKNRTGYEKIKILKLLKGKKSTGKLIRDVIEYILDDVRHAI